MINVDILKIAAVIGVLVFIYFMFSRNKKVAQKEINNLSEVNYKNKSSVKFSDIAGNYEAKESLKEIVDFIKYPDKYNKLGARMPKGLLLYGTPGTGKTLLARALAGEAEVPFFAVSGSDFVQVYAGLGASRIRKLFSKAKKVKKSVIFIDEIDAIGKKRIGGNARGSDEGDRTLNALLTEMSGFEENNSTIVVAATNRIDTLDNALLRPGRFDRQIEIMLPDKKARKEILQLYLSSRPVEDNIDIDKIADQTVYFNGAMLETLVNEAAIIAAKVNSSIIKNEHLESAYLHISAGKEKKQLQVSMKQKKVTAYHEAGHALASKLLVPEDRILRVSIIPTTKGAGGYTLSTTQDTDLVTKEYIKNKMMVLLGGRAAEEIFFGSENVTTGAQNDIEKVTKIALDYIVKYGMHNELGTINYGVLAQEFAIQTNIEKYVKELIEELYRNILNKIKKNIEVLIELADKLIEKETLIEKDILKYAENLI